MIKLCLIAPELAPFTAGGIGVLLHNLIKEYQSESVEFHVLAINDWQTDESTFKLTFPKVKLWRMVDLCGKQHPALTPPEWAFTTHPWHYRSYQVSQAIETLSQQKVEFDIIEFPDWGGLAFCSTQEKLLGRWSKTKIAIRLHSTDAILRSGQPVAGGAAMALLADLERKALRDADIIVSHLQSIADATRDHFGFEKEWDEKVKVDAPPIDRIAVKKSICFNEETPICFPSKIQYLKRPEVFLNGAIAFINSTPEYRGDIIFIAHPTDKTLQEYLKSRIPSNLAHRVSFCESLSQDAREVILKKAISVFPSPFESFCLAAYEASALGGWVALNEANPAFSNETNWKDRENCLKFDGTALSLAEALGNAWRNRNIINISPHNHIPSLTPYWLSEVKFKQKTIYSDKKPLVSVIIPYFNMGRYIIRTLESVFSSTYENLEVVIVDDCSTDAHSQVVIDKIAEAKKFKCVKVVKAPANVGLSAARNLGIRSSNGEYIFTLDSDDLIRGDFIETAVRALENNQQFSIVVPQTAFVSDESSPSEMNVIDYALFIGESFRGGTFVNRFSTATSLGRRDLYNIFPYDENLNSYEDWDFYSRVANGGFRFIVTSDIYFYYRRRANSMIASNNNDKHIRNISMIRSKQKMFSSGSNFDMNIVSDAEGHQRQLIAHLENSRIVAAQKGSNAADGYIQKLKAQIAHQEFLLREASSRLTTVQSIIDQINQPQSVAPEVVSNLSVDNNNSSLSHGLSDDNERNAREKRHFRYFRKIYRNFKKTRSVHKLISEHNFDSQWYLDQYPDVASSGMDAVTHFMLHGRGEGRFPNKDAKYDLQR